MRQYVMDELHAREYKIAWNNGSLLLPETIIADSKEDNSDVFILNTENCFYEFIRTDSEEVAEPLLLSQLQAGGTYRLIVTNDAGMYRLYTDFAVTVENIRCDKIEISCF